MTVKKPQLQKTSIEEASSEEAASVQDVMSWLFGEHPKQKRLDSTESWKGLGRGKYSPYRAFQTIIVILIFSACLALWSAES